MDATRFRDRFDAGARLATQLRGVKGRSDTVVLALRPGGAPVAFELARRLSVPLSLFPVQAIPVEGRPGLALGAVAHGGVEVVDERLVSAMGIPSAFVQQASAHARLELERGPFTAAMAQWPDLRDRIVILVDDGLVVAAIAEAAILAVRASKPSRVIVAAAVGSREMCKRIRVLADNVVCLLAPEPFVSVAEAFETFPDVTAADVRALLEAAGRMAPPAPRGAGHDDDATLVRARAWRLERDHTDYDRLLAGIGDARVVLIGEATHGTHEFYRERALITRRLIEEKHFCAVAVEADWPDAYRVNRFVRGTSGDEDASDALGDFKRFPAWMWRNADVLDFVGWLRAYNDNRAEKDRAGFYGLDLYSLRASAEAVLAYLAKVDPEAAERARRRYACFDRFDREMQAYAYATAYGMAPSCEREVLTQLIELHRNRAEYASRDGRVAPDEFFFAEQNARLVRNAEEYYRMMLRERVSSWNLRDRHMASTLAALIDYLARTRTDARVVVWAHNSHLGDARATEMGEKGELNVGQLTRERFGADAVLVGLTTSRGSVTAASEWDGPARRKEMRLPLPGSYERLFHDVGIARFLLPLRTDADLAGALGHPRLERAIGVLYLPRTERASHYFHARLPAQFDYVLHIDETRAVEPLERTAEWSAEELAETFPSGL